MTIHLLTSYWEQPAAKFGSMGRVTLRYRTALESIRSETGHEVVVDYVDVRRMETKGAYVTSLKRQFRSLMPGSMNGHRSGDIYHAVEPGLGTRGTTATTFHDLWEYGVVNLPNLSTRLGGTLSCYLSRRSICLTPSVRDDVIRYFGRPAARRTRIVTLPFPDPGHQRETPEYDLLWFGNTGPRKNLDGFIEAMWFINSLAGPPRITAMVRCQKHPRYRKDWIFDESDRLRTHGVTVSSDYVPESELDSLYRRSRAVVCTSLSEGLPATLYEAYARGTHVISVPHRSVMDALPPWLPGVHYARSFRSQDIADELEKAREFEPFTPDPGFIQQHSFPVVGRELMKVYEDAQTEG